MRPISDSRERPVHPGDCRNIGPGSVSARARHPSRLQLHQIRCLDPSPKTSMRIRRGCIPARAVSNNRVGNVMIRSQVTSLSIDLQARRLVPHPPGAYYVRNLRRCMQAGKGVWAGCQTSSQERDRVAKEPSGTRQVRCHLVGQRFNSASNNLSPRVAAYEGATGDLNAPGLTGIGNKLPCVSLEIDRHCMAPQQRMHVARFVCLIRRCRYLVVGAGRPDESLTAYLFRAGVTSRRITRAGPRTTCCRFASSLPRDICLANLLHVSAGRQAGRKS